METVCKGIVIKSIDYDEFDNVITILTKEHGQITMLARGVRKMLSKNRPGTTLLAFSEFEFFRARLDNMSKLKRANFITTYQNIIENIDRLSYATYFGAAISRILDDNADYSKAFTLYMSAITALDKMENPEVVFIKFNLELLSFLGLKPVHDKCVVCGNTTDIYSISTKEGGLICSEHASSKDLHFGRDIIVAFYKIIEANWDEISTLNITPISKVTLTKITYEWIKEGSDINLNSLKSISYVN